MDVYIYVIYGIDAYKSPTCYTAPECVDVCLECVSGVGGVMTAITGSRRVGMGRRSCRNQQQLSHSLTPARRSVAQTTTLDRSSQDDCGKYFCHTNNTLSDTQAASVVANHRLIETGSEWE